jgi:serine/threonine protein kinase
LDQLSIEQFYEKHGNPETVTITQCNKDPLPPNVPPKAVLPLYLGKRAEEFSLSEVSVLLSGFGEAFEPASDPRQGKDCHTPLAFRAPEAHFEPEAPLSYPSDIWGLATAIWEILGMKAIFSLEYTDINKIISQHIDVLGPLPLSWWESWEERDVFFDGNGNPKKGRDVWPPINEAFEEGVQKYRRMDKIGEFDREEASAILELVCRMLAFRPGDRPPAEEVLDSEWMVRWALPDFQRSLQAQ